VDPISQGAFGAGWAQSAAGNDRLMPAAVIGAIAGMAPDLDVFISSSSDPLLFLEYHRHFTHALAFAPLGALVCTLVLFRLVPGGLTFAQSYAFALLGFASHGLLDACTTYGTQLLWPFSEARIAWNNVSVVDPLFTLPLIGLLALAVRRRSRYFAVLALGWAFAYLGFGVYQGHRAAAAGAELAASRGHEPSRVDAKPAIASLILWKTIYEHDGRFYVDAVRAAWSTTIFEGGSAKKLDVAVDFPWLEPTSQQARDIERFRLFADDYLAIDDEAANSIVDMRYSMLPNETDALWGIELSPSAPPDRHVRFYTDRDVAPGRASRLFEMLFSASTGGAATHAKAD
jgi:inner membrane protein